MNDSIKKIIIIFLGSIGAAFLSFLTQIIISRTLSVEDYGIIASSLAIAIIVSPFIGFGIPNLLLSLASNKQTSISYYARSITIYLIISTLLLLFGLVVYSFFFVKPFYKQVVTVLFFIVTVSQVFIELTAVYYQSQQRFLNFTFVNLTQHFLRVLLLLVIFIIDVPKEVVSFAGVYSVSAFLVILVFLPIVRKLLYADYFSRPCLDSRAKNVCLMDLVRASSPYGLSGVFFLTYYQIGLVFLGIFDKHEEAALFNVAFLLISVVYLLPTSVFQKYFLPIVHKKYKAEFLSLKSDYYRLQKLSVFLGLACALFIFLFGNHILLMVFSDKYADAKILLLIMTLAIPIKFLNTGMGSLLSHIDNIKYKSKIMGVAAIASIFINMILILFFEAIGAAVSMVLIELILLVLFHNKVKNILGGI